MKIRIKKLHPSAVIPEKKTEGAAALDIHALDEVVIRPNSTVLVKTGISLEIPKGYFGLIFPRSSLAMQRNLILANSAGVMDSDYRGEYMIAFKNIGEEEAVIQSGERCAQLLMLKHEEVEFEEVDKLSDTERGKGGFGSTGK